MPLRSSLQPGSLIWVVSDGEFWPTRVLNPLETFGKSLPTSFKKHFPPSADTCVSFFLSTEGSHSSRSSPIIDVGLLDARDPSQWAPIVNPFTCRPPASASEAVKAAVKQMQIEEAERNTNAESTMEKLETFKRQRNSGELEGKCDEMDPTFPSILPERSSFDHHQTVQLPPVDEGESSVTQRNESSAGRSNCTENPSVTESNSTECSGKSFAISTDRLQSLLGPEWTHVVLLDAFTLIEESDDPSESPTIATRSLTFQESDATALMAATHVCLFPVDTEFPGLPQLCGWLESIACSASPDSTKSDWISKMEVSVVSFPQSTLNNSLDVPCNWRIPVSRSAQWNPFKLPLLLDVTPHVQISSLADRLKIEIRQFGEGRWFRGYGLVVVAGVRSTPAALAQELLTKGSLGKQTVAKLCEETDTFLTESFHPSSSRSEQGGSATATTVGTNLLGGSSEEDPEVTVVSLTCPLAQSLIRIPVKSQQCSHPQCCDAESLLISCLLQQRLWVCPICQCGFTWESLRLDRECLWFLQNFPGVKRAAVYHHVSPGTRSYRLLPTGKDSTEEHERDIIIL